MEAELKEQQTFRNASVRIINRGRVLRLLFQEGSMTQLEIKNRLNLSGPTVTQILQFFKEAGLLREGDEIPSSGGRKPRPIEFCYRSFFAVGVEIRRHHVDVQVMDLKGKTEAGTVRRLVFEDSGAYWRQVNDIVRETVGSGPRAGRVLGVGIAFPGEISPKGNIVSRSTVLGLKNFPLDHIQKNFDYPVYVEYGANAAGFGTVWRSRELKDAVYVIVTNNGVAGSVILNKEIYRGRYNKPGAFGHMVLNPEGRKCFCGGRGCWSAYGALTCLTGEEDPDLEGFFKKLDRGDKGCALRWKEYLERFAQALANIRLSFDTEIIIGGKLAPYLAPRIDELKKMVAAYPALAEDCMDIWVDTEADSPMAEGAALMIVSSFLNDTLEGFHLEQL